MGKSAGKSNHHRSFHTYAEKRMMDYGTKKMRLGKDSQIPFGHCFLSLAPAKEPVVSPSGHIYSKPVICEYMLQKIKELKKQRKAYEAQEAAKSREESRKKSEIEGKSVKEFLAIQDDPTLRTNATSSDGFKKSKEDEESSNKKKRRPREIFDGDTREKKRRALEKVSYWLPSAAPDAGPEQIKKPPKRPPSPITGAPLRMKHLTPATLTLDPDDKSVFICPVSKKRITTQKCILIKTTGHVILKSVFDKIKGQSKDLACPVTGESIRESDVLNLARVSSGFAATGNVMAEKWRPGIG